MTKFTVNRIIVVLAVFGLLLTLHLHIQKARGFDRGCFGFSDVDKNYIAPCKRVVESESGEFFGISVIVPGYFFYATLLLLAFLKLMVKANGEKLLVFAEKLLIVTGFLFSLYLFLYQFYVLDDFCRLCLMSGGTILLLTIVSFYPLSKSECLNKNAEFYLQELIFIVFVFVLGVILVLADLVFLNHVGAPELKVDSVRSIVYESIPDLIDENWLSQMAPCSYKKNVPLYEMKELVREDRPWLGNVDAKVRCLIFFDPGCEKCRILHKTMDKVLPMISHQVKFQYLPLLIHPSSSGEIIAMEKMKNINYYKFVESIMSDQNAGSLTEEQLKKYEKMFPNSLAKTITGKTDDQILLEVEKRSKKLFEMGFDETPSIVINGRLVSRSVGNMSLECIIKLLKIEIEKSGGQGDSEEDVAPW